MIVLGAGILAFVLFILYDINSFRWKNRILHLGFLAGVLLLFSATAGCVGRMLWLQPAPLWRYGVFGLPALVSAWLLFYTLFRALPFDETYREENGKLTVYTEGVYALCRHPGVLWLFLFYLCLTFLVDQRFMLIVCLVYSGMNVLYVLFQDRITFPKTLTGYEAYREKTPFLIPTRNSIKRCIDFFAQRENVR